MSKINKCVKPSCNRAQFIYRKIFLDRYIPSIYFFFSFDFLDIWYLYLNEISNSNESQKSVQHTCSNNTHINYIVTSTRVPHGNFIRSIEIYGFVLTNSMNPPTVSFIHNVIRDGNYSRLRRKIIYSLREKSITARRNFSQLDSHGYYSSGYDLLIGPRKLNSVLGKSLV